MGNILLTNYCNRSCAYCFAQDKVSLHNKKNSRFSREFISSENFEKALAFLKRSSFEKVGLLGGEPTLHPEFPDIIERCLEAGFQIKLFSNGIMPPAALECLARVKPGKILTVVNINHPDETPSSEQDRVSATLETLGARASLGFNIYRPDFDAEFLIDMVKRYNLDPHVRVGLTQPILNGQNRFVLTRDYPEIARRLMSLSRKTGPEELFLELDCGFTLCMFPPEDIGQMIYNGVTFKISCTPIIDINVDLTVWSCFPLSSWETTHLERFDNLQQIVEHYSKKLRPYRATGSMMECLGCRHKAAGNCTGGCAAQSVAAFNSDIFRNV